MQLKRATGCITWTFVPHPALILAKRSLLKDLQLSDLVDHKYHLEGEKEEVLQHVVCTYGTREHLQKEDCHLGKGPILRNDLLAVWGRGIRKEHNCIYNHALV